jgi:hypothetical protein
MEGFLNEKGPVHAASEIGDIEGIDALALDHGRGRIERQSLAARIEDNGDSKDGEDHASHDKPGARLHQGKDAHDGSDNGRQGRQRLKGKSHGQKTEPAPEGAGSLGLIVA